MPVPSVSRQTSLAPMAMPIRDSQSTWQLASLSTTTGMPSRAAITSPNAMSFSGTLTACTAMPLRESNVQGMPKPTASIGLPTAVRISSTASATICTSSSSVRPMTGRLVRWITARSAPTAPARSFVPPRSTPITCPSATPPRYLLPAMADHDDQPQYTLYRSRPKWLSFGRRERNSGERPRGLEEEPRRRRRRPVTVWRVVRWLLALLAAWLLVSLILFLVSAQIESSKVSDAAQAQLSGSGYTLTSPNTILVLGSDARPKGTHEAGAQTIGQPSRSDSILLLRIGGGHNATLSIPRDTVVDIPGHGRNKINAAYAFGGPSLAIRTVEQFLGVRINHLAEVNFANFPRLIDALGGIKYTGGCVTSIISGGRANGGTTLRLKAGTHTLNGKQALALARTRHNQCNSRENDLTRARRQQKILLAIKQRVKSPATFFRLPWVAWAAPKALRTDMRGPSLLGLVGAELFGGGAKPTVLTPSGAVTLPDGGAGLTVDEATKQRAVRRFLAG